jgi:hypothetical protein
MLIIENIRLSELVRVANKNKEIFDYFLRFLSENGIPTLHHFIKLDEESGFKLLNIFFETDLPNNTFLYDGVFSPYDQTKAKWFLIGWILRDAPAQRLQPILGTVEGKTLNQRKSNLLNIVRMQCAQIFPETSSWEWTAIREVFIDRLEGSRRAKKGALFEVIVRDLLNEIISANSLKLKVNKSEIRLENETYDVSVIGSQKTLLIPVKTRETMGGGHAHIFTRDIRESISRAVSAGYEVFPIIIAESWSGDISDLDTSNTIFLSMNPNQIDKIKPVLRRELENRIGILRSL